MLKHVFVSAMIAFAAGIFAAVLTLGLEIVQLREVMKHVQGSGVGMVFGGVSPALTAMAATFVTVLIVDFVRSRNR